MLEEKEKKQEQIRGGNSRLCLDSPGNISITKTVKKRTQQPLGTNAPPQHPASLKPIALLKTIPSTSPALAHSSLSPPTNSPYYVTVFNCPLTPSGNSSLCTNPNCTQSPQKNNARSCAYVK